MLGKIFGQLAGEGVAKPIEAIGGVLDKLFTSDGEKLDKQALLERLAQRPAELQIAVNKIEAQHRSIFVAGWRPFIGWVCGSAFAYNFIFRDLIAWVVVNTGSTAALPPALQMEHLLPVLFGLLGLGGYRTVEKIAGKTK